MNEFHPFKGTQLITFGQNRDSIRKALKNNYKPFLRNQFAKNTTDYYYDLGFFVEYDENDLCNAIEFTSESNLFYRGSDMFKLGFLNLTNFYDPLSKNKEVETEFDRTYFDLGFSVGGSYEDTDEVVSIHIFSQSYWKES